MSFNKIYILAPSKIFTGGPAALHQLGHTIKNKTKFKKVFIYYVPNSNSNSIHPYFKKYKLNVAKKIDDRDNNLLIVSELYPDIKFLNNYKNIQKAIWWLSFDNYLLSFFKSENNKIIQNILKIPFKMVEFFNILTNFFFGNYIFFDYLKDIYSRKEIFRNLTFKNINYHFCQSYYVKKILNKNGCKTYDISDFLNDVFLLGKYNKNKKKNIVTYNKIKSTKFIEFVIKKNKTVKFIPLINLTKNKMVDTLKKSKIYLDFGTHPGKDRIPREAAVLGNCIIVNKKGSAKNKFDIEIPYEFKFDEKYSDIKKINQKINEIFTNHDNEFKKFSYYVSKIKKEEKNFINQVKFFFK